MLRGRCAGCRKRISIHYPLVELITGLLLFYSYLHYQLSIQFFFYSFFFCSLIVISGIDFSHQVIPDFISIPGIVLGILLQILTKNFLSGIIGLGFGGGLILLIRVFGGYVYKKEVMGLGDVFLTAMIGAFIGFPLIIPAIFIASLVGALFGLLYIKATHQTRDVPIPFGPFLGVGGILALLFRSQILSLLFCIGHP